MATRFAIRHETRYDYAGPVREIRTEVRLRPIDWPGQRLVEHQLEVAPEAVARGQAHGPLVNRDWIEVEGPTRSLAIVSHALVDVDRTVPVPRADDPTIEALPTSFVAQGGLDPVALLAPSPRVPHDPAIAAWSRPVLAPHERVLDAAFALARQLNAELRYRPGSTQVDTSPREAFERRIGVCQDFSHVILAGLRANGVPAAYVSGYVRTYPPAGRPRLLGADASHAWVLVWGGPDQGWVGIDPTNALWMAGDHIVTAIGRDYGDVAPVEGVFTGPSGGRMRVGVDVAPIAPTGSGS